MHSTASELHSWGAAHGALWDVLRKKGRQVRVIGIGAENRTVERAERILWAWAAADPGEPSEALTVKQEIKLTGEAMDHDDKEVLGQYGGIQWSSATIGGVAKSPRIESDGRGLD